MSKLIIGIDNGTSGTVGILGLKRGPLFFAPPTKMEQDYTKAKNNITRIDFPAYEKQITAILGEFMKEKGVEVRAFVERPMVNPAMFKTSGRALRCLEATLILLERLGIGHEFVDSKQWQKAMLPQGIKGSAALKKASMEVGKRLFPLYAESFHRHKDADGMLIAEWARKYC